VRRLTVLLLCLFPALCQAHPSHVTLTEVELDQGHLEVGIQLHRADLDRAISQEQRAGNFEAAVRALLLADLVLKDKNGSTLAFQWVGIEEKGFAVWAYIQWAPGQVQRGHTLTNQLLLDVQPKIVHTVNFKAKSARSSLTFRRSQTTHLLPSFLRGEAQ